MPNSTIDALLIAAGYSGRMGEFKPLLKLNNKPFIICIIEKLLKVCENVFIVTGFRHEDIEFTIQKFIDERPDYTNRIKCIHNQSFESGMFSSVQTGIKEINESKWILFHFVDQPGIPENFYSEFVDQIDEKYDWIQPTFSLRNGHPVIFKNTVFKKIIDSPSGFEMKLIREDEEVKKKYWFTEDSFILDDIDTKEDFINFLKNQ